MITRFANLTSRVAAVLVILCTIVACGGGGGGSNSGFIPDDGTQGAYWLGIVMLDAQGQPTNTVTSTAPATIQVTVRRNGKNGKLVADVVVSGTTDLGVLFPDTGSALTNADGVATFQLEVDAAKGAGMFTATATNDDGVTTSETLAFQAGSSGLRLGYFDNDGDFIENEIQVEPAGVLAASGNAQLTLAILDEDGNVVTTSESVRFSSACLSSGQATLSPESPVTSGNGRIATTYTAGGCGGVDQITATLAGASAQAFASLEIAAPSANRLNFVSAEPDLIVLKGTGGGADRQEFSDVVFTAVDSNNQPLQGIEVDFSLTTYVGGLSVSPATAVSDADGNVKVTVFSGDVATVVRVVATTSAGDGTGEVSTVSDILTVSTGLPDQNSISLSVTGSFVVEEGMTKDGITREINVRMADKFNNPVPDGTAAVFTTEFGVIQPSCVTTDGSCSVTWTSSNPRTPTLDAIRDNIQTINSADYNCPSHNGSSGPCPDDLGFVRGGRSTLLVSAIGEESFVDRNGNGVMDQDEKDLFDNVPEAHLDNNEDGIYNPAQPGCEGIDVEDATGACLAGFEEEYKDFNSNGVYDLNNDPAVYNGLLCPLEGDGVWCSRELVNVRDSIVLILSTDPNWDIALYRSRTRISGTTTNGGPYTAYISDIFNSQPTAGSTVTVEATENCEIVGQSSFEVPNSIMPGAFAVTFEQGGVTEYDSCAAGPIPSTRGDLIITLSPQNGGPDYTETYSCTTNLVNTAPDPNCPP